MNENIYIGLEWEPQIVLIKEPEIHVSFLGRGAILHKRGMDYKDRCESRYREYSINFYTRRVGFDNGNGNLEVRSFPVLLENLPMELEQVNTEVTWFMKKLVKLLGPCVLMLPDAKPQHVSKHMNLSRTSNYLEGKFDKDLFQLKRAFDLMEKHEDDKKRAHVKVPYNFRHYYLIPQLINVPEETAIHYLQLAQCFPLNDYTSSRQMIGMSTDGKEYQKISNLY